MVSVLRMGEVERVLPLARTQVSVDEKQRMNFSIRLRRTAREET
jgi:hypothetical protein